MENADGRHMGKICLEATTGDVIAYKKQLTPLGTELELVHRESAQERP